MVHNNPSLSLELKVKQSAAKLNSFVNTLKPVHQMAMKSNSNYFSMKNNEGDFNFEDAQFSDTPSHGDFGFDDSAGSGSGHDDDD